MAFSLQYIGAKDLVLTEKKLNLRTITLNRPKQMNVISYRMIMTLLKLYDSIERDESVKLVILKGNGKAFCAGGDIAAGINLVNYGYWSFAAKYYEKQLGLDYIIATLEKPQVSFLDGFVMGVGVGISINGLFRVATENTVFAMPETMLGQFPDVGASYFLSRLPGYFGEYCGLTGARLDGHEMVALGLATHFVPSMRLQELEEALSNVNVVDPKIVSTTINRFSEQIFVSKQSACFRMELINKCFSKRTVEDIVYALEKEAANGHDQWLKGTIRSLKKASPISLKIALRSIREGRHQSIKECLIREYIMFCHVWKGDISKDLFEGSRALLLDKDKNPQWEPSNLEMIDDEMVDLYFKKVNDEEWKDLMLPLRSHVDSSKIYSKL